MCSGGRSTSLCEHTFVLTSDGSPYTRFKRALATGNLNLIRAAAAELPRVGLSDALEVCLLMRNNVASSHLSSVESDAKRRTKKFQSQLWKC